MCGLTCNQEGIAYEKKTIALMVMWCLLLSSRSGQDGGKEIVEATEDTDLQVPAVDDVTTAASYMPSDEEDPVSWEKGYLEYLEENILPDSYYTYDFIYVDDAIFLK